MTRHRERGIALLWTVVTLLAMLALAGLSIDMGYSKWTAQQLQVGADAAALAGAKYVRRDGDAARQAAVNVGAANQAAKASILLGLNAANLPAGDIVLGRYNRSTKVFTPTTHYPGAIKVVSRRTTGSLGGPLPLIFGPGFGFPTTELARYAIAVNDSMGNGIIILDPNAPTALDIQGSVYLDLNGAAIQVDSSNPKAVGVTGAKADTNAEQLNVVGSMGHSSNVNFDDILRTGTPYVPDPLAGLPSPNYLSMTNRGSVYQTNTNTHATLDPGYYPGGISATGGTLNLQPGIYALGAPGLDIGGNTQLVANGVMFYLVGNGALNLNGTGLVQITPPDPASYPFPGADVYEGISVFEARNNTSPSTITGTSLMTLAGTIYCPAALLTIDGTSDMVGNQVISNKFRIKGNGRLRIDYDGRNSPPGNVFLIE